MAVTPTGIAVTLAVVIAVGFLFFGSSLFSLISPSGLPASVLDTSGLEGSAGPEGAANGLSITDTVVGDGREAQAGDTVSVNYTGQLEDGTVFDSSTGRGPFIFTLGAGQVIPGWEQGILGMKEGGRRTLVIPPELAYGNADLGVIPPNSTLIFEVELISVGE